MVPGPCCFITDLRPQTIIKDDAVVTLLRQQSLPTFVTINERDFWRGVPPDDRYCVACFAIPDRRAREVPALLRALLRRAEFRTKAQRAGKVIRVANQEISYYTAQDRTQTYVR